MILLYYDITFDLLKMTQIDKVDFLMLVEGRALYYYKTEYTTSLLSCKLFVLTTLGHSESRTPQLCPVLGGPVWLGQDQHVDEGLWNLRCFLVCLGI